MVDFKFGLVCVFRHTGRLSNCRLYPPPHCSSQCWDAENGKGWQLPGWMGFAVLFNWVREGMYWM